MRHSHLEITFRLVGVSTPYETDPTWPGAAFRMDEGADDTALLTLWLDRVPPDSAKNACEQLHKKAESFALARKYLYGEANLIWKMKPPIRYRLDDTVHEFSACDHVHFERLDNGHALIVSEIPMLHAELTGTIRRRPPSEIPLIPLDCERLAITLVEAMASDYVDEMLKREFLILEEFGAQDQIENLRYVRNFVSHAVCNKADTVAFIKRALPSAVTGQPEVAIFDRTNREHIQLIGQYEVKARELARKLVDQRIEESRALGW
jgi:hypothetical protein